MRINKATISALKDHPSEPCAEGIKAALAWVGERDEPLTPNLWWEFDEHDTDNALWFLRNLAPEQLLRGLEREVSLQLDIACNDNAPSDMLGRFSESFRWVVRAQAARHRNMPIDVLERLSEDEHTGVRHAVAGNQNTPAAVLERLSADSEARVRCNTARNRNTPADALERLSADSSANVRYAVASNRSAPVGILVQLRQDADREVRTMVYETLTSLSA